MTTRNALIQYAALKPEDLEFECPGIQFRGFDSKNIPEFESDDGPAILDFLEALNKTTYPQNPKDDYRYKDGATVRFIQYRRCFDIKDQKKVIGRVYLKKG